MDKTENRICWYSSLLIALLMCSPKLLALRENGIIAHLWHFNLAEFILQLIFNFLFCYLLFYFNLKSKNGLIIQASQKKYFYWFLLNALLLITGCVISGFIQRRLFTNIQLPGAYWAGYLGRFILSGILAGIIIKIILLLRESKRKDSENLNLKTAYLEAELELLKEQLNPHFLFNSLSSLSGVIRENPPLAQHFINHLSKIFRYALTQSGSHLVTVGQEITMIKSYGELLTMRFEKAFQLDIDVDDAYYEYQIPHLSLQPLLENAAKHNSATLLNPLCVKIYVKDSELIVSNNLQQIERPENSTGIGLANLNSRFRILMHHEIEILKNANTFFVKLPLKT